MTALKWMTTLLLVCAACEPWDAPYLAQRASETRGLRLWKTVPVVEMTREEFAQRAEENATAIDDEVLADYAATYGRLGFFDPALDLRPIFAGSSSDWVGASYSPSAQQITLVGEARPDTIVHEWVHALQDQNFGLSAYDDYETSDAFLARRAVVEGDATLADMRFWLREDEQLPLTFVDWEYTFGSYRAWSDNMLVDGDYPPLFLDYPSFVYTYGLELCANAVLGVTAEEPYRVTEPEPFGWERINVFYESARPSSTAEVLRLGERPTADPIGLHDVPPALADQLALHDRDVLGQWHSLLLLLGSLSLQDARELAGGWRSDRVLWVEHVATEEIAVVWGSAWASEEVADAVAQALAALHGREPVPNSSPSVGVAADGEPLWIERRADRIVFIKNLEPSVAIDVADAAFANTSFAPMRRRRPSPAQRIAPLARSHERAAPLLATGSATVAR